MRSLIAHANEHGFTISTLVNTYASDAAEAEVSTLREGSILAEIWC